MLTVEGDTSSIALIRADAAVQQHMQDQAGWSGEKSNWVRLAKPMQLCIEQCHELDVSYIQTKEYTVLCVFLSLVVAVGQQ
jgi:hypothetical protein